MWRLDRNEYVSAGTIPGSIFPAARFFPPILPSCSIYFIRILIGERGGDVCRLLRRRQQDVFDAPDVETGDICRLTSIGR